MQQGMVLDFQQWWFMWRLSGVFDAFCVIFRAPSGCPGVERQFFRALDDEEFFVVEGSLANS